MAVIDAQVHAYERDHPGRPWAAPLHGPAEVTGDQMVAAMDAVGVDGALLTSVWTMYRYDPSYAIACQQAHPGRFALVAPFDPRAAGVGEAVERWAAVPGAVAARLMLRGSTAADVDARSGIDAVLAAAGRVGLPVCVLAWGHLDLVDELAAAHPGTQLVLDHLGIPQPFEPPVPAEPWRDLPAVVALARHANLALKVTGACTLSREPFPFADLWEPLGRLFDAFGFDRCLWGTDWTRAAELVTYADAVEAFRTTDRLSSSEREALMGGSAERLFRWSPSR